MPATAPQSAMPYDRDIDHLSPCTRVDADAGTSVGVRRTAVAVVTLHLLLLVASQWMVFSQFRQRMPGAFHDALAAEFAAKTATMLTIETVALLLGGLAAVGALKAFRSRRHAGRIAVLLLLSYVPIALYTSGVLLAFAMGWTVDAVLLATPGASPADVAATIGDALPVVLEPLTLGRHAANIIGILVFAALLRRRERASMTGATGAAALVILILTLAVVLMQQL
jgi:hypothetical protein